MEEVYETLEYGSPEEITRNPVVSSIPYFLGCLLRLSRFLKIIGNEYAFGSNNFTAILCTGFNRSMVELKERYEHPRMKRLAEAAAAPL